MVACSSRRSTQGMWVRRTHLCLPLQPHQKFQLLHAVPRQLGVNLWAGVVKVAVFYLRLKMGDGPSV